MTANFAVRTIATLSLLILCTQSPLSVPVSADESIDRRVEADMDARIELFELAFRMQTEAPEVLAISRESDSTMPAAMHRQVLG